MRFNDGYLETIVEQENDTLKIQELIENNVNKQIIVLGDFNSDMWRDKKFDEVVANMIEKSNLVCFDLLFTQKINYTYKLGRGKSWVDHALVNQLLTERVVSVNILNKVEDQINTSDHRAMEVVIERFRQDKQMIVKRAKQIKLDWECLEVQEEYERNVNDEQMQINLNGISQASGSTVVARLDEMINEINSKLQKAVEKTKINFANVQNKYIKKKKWWDYEMTYIKQQINSAYIRYKNSNFSVEHGSDYRKFRTHFRNKQREKIKLSQKRVQKK
jgi:hypothetical protein